MDSNGLPHTKTILALRAERYQERFHALFQPLARWFESDYEFLTCLEATFSHHGEPIDFGNSPDAERYAAAFAPHGDQDPFEDMAAALTRLQQWFPPAFMNDAPPLPSCPQFSHLFAGLVSLADWIGSDEELFPYCGEETRRDCEDPMPFARDAARSTLERLALDCAPLRRQPLPAFKALFPFAPNPLQQAVASIPLDDEARIVILETETGSGKTEAALYHFARLFFAGKVDGLYLANPLWLAARQIHERCTEFAEALFPRHGPVPVLAIPGYIQAGSAQGQRLPQFRVLWPADAGQDPKRFWAAESPKRFLASAMAVGTIDQALLSVIRTRHSHLRAARNLP